MSSALYDVRLFWDDNLGHGCAKTPGVYRHLTVCPAIKGIRSFPSLLDFAPETDTAVIHGVLEANERAMTTAEKAAAVAYLNSLQLGPIIINPESKPCP